MSFGFSLGPLNHHLMCCHAELNLQLGFYGAFMEWNSSGLEELRLF